jgi:hypothetical protein
MDVLYVRQKMEDLIESAMKIAERWDRKTLEDFRQQAVLEDSGNVFDAVRESDGRRIHLAVCATGHDQLEAIFSDLSFVEDAPPKDWNSTSLLALLVENLNKHQPLTFEVLRSQSRMPLALIFVATTPDSIKILEGWFGLPK